MLRFLYFAVPFGLCVIFALGRCVKPAMAAAPTNDDDVAYSQVIHERAGKIVDSLAIDEPDKSKRLQEMIANYYRRLRDVHDARDAQLKQALASPGADSEVDKASSNDARERADLQLHELHRRFVARLSAELEPVQVEAVKDGLTYGVVKVTYDRYLQLLPGLNDAQRREILANLIEAREYAMDGGSSEEKHAIFGKYKGRINNFLSDQGFDLKAAEQDLAARQKAATKDR